MHIPPVYIDALWLGIAFFMGVLAKKINMPPLIGFLLTGILLNFFGITNGDIHAVLNTISQLGIMLLLFTIGLKIKIKSLFKKEVWVTASVHTLISTLLVAGFVYFLSFQSLLLFTDLTWKSAMLIGFAMSFSSTVFIVKILEEKGELTSFHGKIAIGILILQDIFAVVFLSLSNSDLPSWWALLLPVFLYLVRFLLNRMLHWAGHGELLTVFGFFCTFVVGGISFKWAGLKPDLGALAAGMILVKHPKAEELYDRMMNYKDFFLIAFFISIGLNGVPTIDILLMSVILSIFIFIKGGLFIWLFSFFNIKPRTGFLTSLILSNFSEFGLICAFVGQQMGLLSNEWMLILAMLMSFSFFLASPINTYAHQIFDRNKKLISMINRCDVSEDTDAIYFAKATYLVIGMGSLGLPAYRYLEKNYDINQIMGIDYNHDKLKQLQEKNINVLYADATNSLFWATGHFENIKMILLAMSDFSSNKNVMLEISKLKKRNFQVGVICHYKDEYQDFQKLGADFLYDYKSNVGADFAEQILIQMNQLKVTKV